MHTILREIKGTMGVSESITAKLKCTIEHWIMFITYIATHICIHMMDLPSPLLRRLQHIYVQVY